MRSCSPDATYLVTGGLGSLGLKAAGWLADRGARHLVLVGRRGLPERSAWEGVQDGDLAGRIAAVQQLEARGVQVRVAQADITDRASLSELFAGLRAANHPLRGVVHAAGVSIPQAVRTLSRADLDAVLHPKLAGTWLIHELTADLPLDFFVLFSSISSVWGSKGLAHYAAANHFLDAVAHHRRAYGLPALSVNWGPWSGGGMASENDRRTLAALGVESLEPRTAFACLDALLPRSTPQAIVAQVDWTVFKPVYGAKLRRHLLDRIDAQPAAAHAVARAQPDILRELNDSRAADRMPLLIEAIQREVAAVFRETGGVLPDPNERFFEAGMDSLMAVELRRRVEALLGASLPATLAFDYPSVARLSDYVAGVLKLDTAAEEAPRECAPATIEPLAMVSELSEEEIERIFAERVLNSEVSR